jgi:hypothetical protein
MRGTIEVVDDGSSPIDTAETEGDPIIEVLTAASVDIDAEPQLTANWYPDRRRGGLYLNEAVTLPTQLGDSAWRLQHTPAEGTDILQDANPEISDDALRDLAAFLWSEAEPDPATVELYAKNCAACHGESGTGDGPAAGLTAETTASFADAAWMRRGDIWYAKIRRGGVGTDMPNFGTLFTVEETLALVDYLWFLAFEPPTQ